MENYQPITIGPNARNIAGKSFGRLTAVIPVSRTPGGQICWLFTCACGNNRVPAAKEVTNGHTRSCGCLARDLLVKRNFKHGHSKHNNVSTPTFSSWLQMRKRIFDKTYHAYEHYRARGITICDRWLDEERGFLNFLADMGTRPSAEHSLDRIENDKGYYKENCRWATRIEQMNNVSSNRLHTFAGKTMTQEEWGRHIGLNGTIICKRLKRGWSLEKTLTTGRLR